MFAPFIHHWQVTQLDSQLQQLAGQDDAAAVAQERLRAQLADRDGELAAAGERVAAAAAAHAAKTEECARCAGGEGPVMICCACTVVGSGKKVLAHCLLCRRAAAPAQGEPPAQPVMQPAHQDERQRGAKAVTVKAF